MKTYRELYFNGTSEEILKFINEIGNYAVGDWSLKKESIYSKDYLSFFYTGNDVNKSFVSIYIGNKNTNELHVGNIVPSLKSSLSVDEYNAVLLKFYEDVIKPYKKNSTNLKISQPTDDIFNPLTVISSEALKKLKSFSNSANKSTGSTHPCDRERWFDFICQTVDDGRKFDCDTLAKFLSDTVYWNSKPKNLIGCIGHYAWTPEKAYELALEYESLCEILEYYKKNRELI